LWDSFSPRVANRPWYSPLMQTVLRIWSGRGPPRAQVWENGKSIGRSGGAGLSLSQLSLVGLARKASKRTTITCVRTCTECRPLGCVICSWAWVDIQQVLSPSLSPISPRTHLPIFLATLIQHCPLARACGGEDECGQLLARQRLRDGGEKYEGLQRG
jgi:hypothetical protein